MTKLQQANSNTYESKANVPNEARHVLWNDGAQGWICSVPIANEATRQEVYGHRVGQDRDIDLSWFDWTLGRALSTDGKWAVLEEDGEGGVLGPPRMRWAGMLFEIADPYRGFR